jgi:Transposase DDE domain
VSPETLLATAYAGMMLAGALGLEWLSAHTHRRALRFRTAGFAYDDTHDHWTCPEGQHLWPHEFDHERRLVRYRAKAHICNGCPVKERCTDSDTGREVVRPVDPWPHSEAGRFHRVIALLLVGVAALVLVAAGIRNHAPAEAGLLLGALALTVAAAAWLARDLHRHPAGFPAATPSHGLGLTVTTAEAARPRSRWASENRAR